MLCLDTNQPEPNYSEKAHQLLQPLRIIMIFQLIFGISFVLVNPWDGFILLIAAALLWCGIRTANFCKMLFYNVICLFGIYQIVVYIGDWYVSDDYKDDSDYKKIVMYISMASILFYLIAIYYSFLAYREFKAMMYEQMHGGAGFGGFGFNQQQQVQYSNILYLGAQDQQQNQYQPQYIAQQPYQNQQQQQQFQLPQQQPFPAPGIPQQQQQQQNRGYVPFGGKGYVLG